MKQEYLQSNIQFSGPVGKVYIHKHISGSLVKVGETSKSSQARLKGYSKDWDLKGFSFHKEYLVPLDARKEIEKSAQYKLGKSRIVSKRWLRKLFLCGVSQAERAVERSISKTKRSQRRKTVILLRLSMMLLWKPTERKPFNLFKIPLGIKQK